MTKGIVVATTGIPFANSDERVVDSRAPGSWKIAKRMEINFPITRTGGAAVSATRAEPHGLNYTPAFIAMLESDIGDGQVLYNIPAFQSTFSAKVFVDSKKVYCTVVNGLTGTFQCNFKILLLGEKIE